MAYAFVQQAYAAKTAAGTVINTGTDGPAFPSNLTDGNLLVWYVAYTAAASKTVTISDNRGNTAKYVSPTGCNVYDAGLQQGYIWGYAANIVSGGGIDTVTATFSGSSTFICLYVKELSGLDTTAPFQNTVSGANKQASPGTGADALTTTNITVTAQPAVLDALCQDFTASALPTAGTGFSSRVGVWDFGGLSARPEDKRLTSTSAVPATFTAVNGTDTYFTIGMVFSETGASGGATNSGTGAGTAGSSGSGVAASVGVGSAGSPTTLYSRPYLNVSVGNWLGSSGSQLANDIDEPTASDTDYIYDANTGVDGEYRLEPIPDAGTQYGLILHYRPEARWWDSTIVTTLLYGSTQISQWTDSLTANAGATTLDKTLTVTEITAIRTASSNASIWTDLRLRHSATQ